MPEVEGFNFTNAHVLDEVTGESIAWKPDQTEVDKQARIAQLEKDIFELQQHHRSAASSYEEAWLQQLFDEACAELDVLEDRNKIEEKK